MSTIHSGSAGSSEIVADFVLSRRALTWAVIGCIVVLHLLNVPAVAFKYVWPSALGARYMDFFGVSGEGKLPTFYSGVTLLAAAGLLGLIAARARQLRERGATRWAGLAVVFVLIAADELLVIHELTIGPMRRAFGITSGPLYFAWVILAIPLLVGLGAVYVRFLLALPPPTRRGFLTAAVIYVGGVLVFEVVSGAYISERGDDLGYGVLATLEEMAEMCGVAVFLSALTGHLSRVMPRSQLRFAD